MDKAYTLGDRENKARKPGMWGGYGREIRVEGDFGPFMWGRATLTSQW